MSKIILWMIATSLFLAACSAKPEINTNTANANNNPQPASASSDNGNAPANTNANKYVNTSANVKQTDNVPKRIAFNKGANWGATNITLAPGAAQKFVVGGKKDQTMDVEVSSKEISVNLIKGKAQTTEDFGYLNAELQANGDYVFEVKNGTKKEIKTSVKVTIEGGKTDTSEIDESDATVNDDEDVPPPPTNRKDN